MGQLDKSELSESIIRLLQTKTDEEIVALTGCGLDDVIALRAMRATAPFPPQLHRHADDNASGQN